MPAELKNSEKTKMIIFDKTFAVDIAFFFERIKNKVFATGGVGGKNAFPSQPSPAS